MEENKQNHSIKRDTSDENRFIKLIAFYHVCAQKFENEYKDYQGKIKRDPILQSRHEDFMKRVKDTRGTLSQIVDVTYNIANILQKSKGESRERNHEMYFFQSFYFLRYFLGIFSQDIKVNTILSQIAVVIFLKNCGHSLAYDIFLGWATHITQLFTDPKSIKSVEEIELLSFVSGLKNQYIDTYKKIAAIFCGLICINPTNLLLFLKDVTKQDDAYTQLSQSYNKLVNCDIEQTDYYWHFVDKYFRHSAMHFNHINVIIMSTFIELSYIQMKSAQNMFSKSNPLYKSTLCASSTEYASLFQFIEKTVLPNIKQRFSAFSKNNSDFTYQSIALGTTTLSILTNDIEESIQRMAKYNNRTLFENEVERLGDETLLEKGAQVKKSYNPFNFLRLL